MFRQLVLVAVLVVVGVALGEEENRLYLEEIIRKTVSEQASDYVMNLTLIEKKGKMFSCVTASCKCKTICSSL